MRSFTRSRAGIILTAGLTAFVLVGAPARADDAKLYPGAICHDTLATGFLKYAFGTAVNDSTSVLKVTCPLIHDTTKLYTVDLYIQDNNPLVDPGCVVWLSDWNGGLVDWRKSGSRSMEGGSVANMKGFMGFGFKTVQYGNYTVQCNLPGKYNDKRSTITGMWVVEKE